MRLGPWVQSQDKTKLDEWDEANAGSTIQPTCRLSLFNLPRIPSAHMTILQSTSSTTYIYFKSFTPPLLRNRPSAWRRTIHFSSCRYTARDHSLTRFWPDFSISVSEHPPPSSLYRYLQSATGDSLNFKFQTYPNGYCWILLDPPSTFMRPEQSMRFFEVVGNYSR